MPVPTTHLRSAVQHHPLQPRRARCRRPQPSRAFYENTVGLHVEDADDKAVYLRGSEEHQHHSLVLRKAPVAACSRLGFKVGNDDDLDKAASFFSENGIAYAFVEQPFQGRTLQFTDPFGIQIELYASMDKRPHLLQRYDLYKGCHPQRLDHFNVFAPEVQDTVDFYARLGFRLTEYAEEDGPNGRIAAAWMHRKGNVHDFAFTNGARAAPAPLRLLGADRDEHHASLRRDGVHRLSREHGARAGPARHLQRVLPLRARSRRSPPRALHLRLFHRGHDHEPLRWSLRDPRRQTLWGAPAPRSWFEEGSPFAGQPVREPAFVADVTIAD